MLKETYQDYHKNVLEALSDGNVYRNKDIRQKVIQNYDYSDEELNETLPSGKNRIGDRIGWSITYLKKAKVIENVKTGHYKITQRGKELLEQTSKITDETLKQFPEFCEYLNISNGKSTQYPKDNQEDTEQEKTPLEQIEDNFFKINNDLANELLETIKTMSPYLFERLVVDLLLKMGYGGSREDAGQAIGKSGDEGIDGIINEDILGLDNIYIQAKRWENVVGRPEIQKFTGALAGQKAKKGVFITTANFSKNAIAYAKDVDYKIILIDGVKLSNLMINYNVGVSVETTYEIKKIDNDYFEDI